MSRLALSPRRVVLGVAAVILAVLVLYIPQYFEAFRVAQFSDVIAISVAVLGLALLTGFNGQISIGHGAFFLLGPDQQRLRLIAGYAYRERKDLAQQFRIGEGLVGQCALEHQPITLTRPPADYVRIGSSLGEAVPTVLSVLP